MLLRVNQVGYPAGCPKRAFLMTAQPLDAAVFEVRDARSGRVALRSRIGPRSGSFSAAWPNVYVLDFDALTRPGSYWVTIGTAGSPAFAIGTGHRIYSALAADVVSFLRAQRDGPHVTPGSLRRAPSHLNDITATVYRRPRYAGRRLIGDLSPTGTRIDASGGWFDAGDYLKFVETASFDDVMALFALREYPRTVSGNALRDEARFGTDWLLRMWDGSKGVLYYQVGLGDGNGGSITGDHDLWRLPQADDLLRVGRHSPDYYIAHRPVFAANAPGGLISPNLAGRVAGAFALCAQDFAGVDAAYARRCLRAAQQIYSRADPSPRSAPLTTSPHAYYNEPIWRDDMELGATELYLATRKLGGAGMPQPDANSYLPSAGHWADAYISSPTEGADSLNLYDVSTLAHYDLVRILRSAEFAAAQDLPGIDVTTDPNALIKDMRDQLTLGVALGARQPFGLSNPATNVDTVPHALGYAIQARLYDALTGGPTFESLALSQLNWVLGDNAWGSTFIVGAGSVFPHCLAHQVANLSGSLTGQGAIMRGATVDGPTSLANLQGLGAPDGYRTCPPRGMVDPFVTLRSMDSGYLDDVRSSNTSEPSNDYAALALVALAQQSVR